MFIKIGVYRKDENAIERCIISIKRGAKKNFRSEVKEYIRICRTKPELQISEQFVNFQNGLYDLINRRLIEHSPAYFTTIQIHANYIDYDKLQTNKFMYEFMNSIMCNNPERVLALRQITGYCLTNRTDLQLAFFFFGPTAKNGKSTLIEVINKMIGRENISHVTMLQLSERFSASDLTDKILNTETEVEKDAIKNIEVFKKLVTGDEFAVEEKYKPRYTIKPMAKFIYATNNLPRLDGVDDEGYYRRLYILPFEKRITKEEELQFDKNNILSQEAIDWLASTVVHDYEKIMDSKEIANKQESNKIIATYRETSNSVTVFLKDEFAMKDVFAHSNHLPKTAMYGRYVGWCKENNLYAKPRKKFFTEVLSNPEYQECKIDGYDHIRNTDIKPDGLKEKSLTF